MSSTKRFVKLKCLALILSEENINDMYSSSQEYKKEFGQNHVRSISIGMPIACFIFTFTLLK